MEYVITFILSFILIYLIYYILFIRKAGRKTKKSSEVQYLISLYKLDTSKFSYYRFVRMVGLVTSFDIALVTTIVMNFGDVMWQILLGFVVVIPTAILSFMLLGKYYKNKETKDNTKELEKEKKYLEKKDKKKKKKESKKKGKKKNG